MPCREAIAGKWHERTPDQYLFRVEIRRIFYLAKPSALGEVRFQQRADAVGKFRAEVAIAQRGRDGIVEFHAAAVPFAAPMRNLPGALH